MAERRFRKPNALKHGAFSRIELFPWEDPKALEELRRGLLECYHPEGPVQQDCVNTMLSCLWRKQRLRDRRAFEIAAVDRVKDRALWEDPLLDEKMESAMLQFSMTQSPSRAPHDDYRQLFAFSNSLFESIDEASVDIRIEMLPSEFSSYLKQEVPRSNFKEIWHWVRAIKNQIDTVLVPMVREREPKGNAYFEAARLLASDHILKDLEVEERLDAMMERAMKRLYADQLSRELHISKQSRLIENESPKQLGRPSAKAKAEANKG
jgi:hypothetical protein